MMFLILTFIAIFLHPFHMSVTEIHYKKDKATMEISHRIFADDLEKAIERKFNKKCDFTKEQGKEIDGFIEKYIDETFKISADGMALESKFVGKELDKDAIMVYMEIGSVDNVKTVKISDKVLFELFNDQSNLIHFHNGKNVTSKKLNAKVTEANFEFHN